MGKPEVVCELDYRWPGHGLAVSYFDFSFSGKRKEEYKQKWKEFKKKNWCYQDNEKQRVIRKKDLKDTKKKIEEFVNAKNPYKWWKQTYKWRIWRINRKVEIKELTDRKNKLEFESELDYDDKVWDKIICIHSFLAQYGFYKFSKTDKDYNRTIEMWAI